MLYQVLAAPYYPVCFRDGFIGDILTSLVRVLIPLLSSSIYIVVVVLSYLFNDFRLMSSDNHHSPYKWWEKTKVYQYYVIPFVTLYPLYIRFMQCLRRSVESGDSYPHHYNALKYASAITCIAFGTFQPSLRHNSIWVCLLILTTLYQLYWDLVMDWGLLTLRSQRKYYIASHSRTSTSATTDTSTNSSHGHGNQGSGSKSNSNNSTGSSSSSSSSSWLSDQCVHICSLCSCVKLRSSRLLSQKPWFYYSIIIFNSLFRFAWTLTLLTYMYDPNSSIQNNSSSSGSGSGSVVSSISSSVNGVVAGVIGQELVLKPSFLQVLISHTGPVIATAEIVRRMVWGWLRLEHEHIEVLGMAVPAAPAPASASAGSTRRSVNQAHSTAGSDTGRTATTESTTNERAQQTETTAAESFNTLEKVC